MSRNKKISTFHYREGEINRTFDIRLKYGYGASAFIIDDPVTDCHAESADINAVQSQMKNQLNEFYKIKFDPCLLVTFQVEQDDTQKSALELSYDIIEVAGPDKKHYREPKQRYLHVLPKLGTQEGFHGPKTVSLIPDTEANRAALDRFIVCLNNTADQLARFLTPETITKTLGYQDFRKLLPAPERPIK